MPVERRLASRKLYGALRYQERSYGMVFLSLWSTTKRLLKGGIARCGQFVRLQMRQEMPIGSKAERCEISSPSAYMKSVA